MSKFRLWDKRFSEFVKDFFVSEDGKIYKKSTDTGYGIAISRETSDEVILMQSTGLFDKKGVEIFEGDIFARNGRETLSIVRRGILYSNLCFYIEEEYNGVKSFEPFNPHLPHFYTIVGNIYENEDLLKGTKEDIATVEELEVKALYDEERGRWVIGSDEETVEKMNAFLSKHDLEVFELWLGYLEDCMSDELFAFINILETIENGEIKLYDGSKIKLVEG